MLSQRGESVVCQKRDFRHSEMTQTGEWVVRILIFFLFANKNGKTSLASSNSLAVRSGCGI